MIRLKAIRTIKENKDIIYCLADILLNEKQYEQALKTLDSLPKESRATRFMEIKASCEEALGQDNAAENTVDMIFFIKAFSQVVFFIKSKLP